MAGAAALTVLASARAASADSHHEHHEHHHSAANAELVAAALDCVRRGDECTAHCLAEFKAGDTSLAECAAAVEETVAVCVALAKLAALDSKNLGSFAAACAEICEHCETECRVHEDTHESCRACADACARCVEECKKVSRGA